MQLEMDLELYLLQKLRRTVTFTSSVIIRALKESVLQGISLCLLVLARTNQISDVVQTSEPLFCNINKDDVSFLSVSPFPS